MDHFPFERLPAELRLMVYLAIDDEPIKLRCLQSKYYSAWLCSRGDATSMCPKALLALSSVSSSIRLEVARLFTDGEYGLSAIFKQSMAVFLGWFAMLRFGGENPNMAKEVRAAMLIGIGECFDGGDWYYQDAFCTWEMPKTGDDDMFELYPAVTKIEMRRLSAKPIVHRGGLLHCWGHPSLITWLDPRRGFTLHQEADALPWEGREPIKVLMYREIGEKIPPKAVLQSPRWIRCDGQDLA